MDGPAAEAVNGDEVQYSGSIEEHHSSERSLKFVLLYGTLDVWIHSAKNLPNMDAFSDSLRHCLTVFTSCKKALPKFEEKMTRISHRKITSDPYVCVLLKGATVARTRVISNDQEPRWNEHFVIPVAHKVAEVELVVKDSDMLGAQYIGEMKIPAEHLLNESVDKQFFDLVTKDGKPCKPGAQIEISLRFCPVGMDPLFKDGVGKGPNYRGVPNTYFPLRTGGRLTLYQDAHVPDNYLPEITLDKGVKFQHRNCWEDICEALLDAQHVIYIAGWSIYTKTKLVRNTNKPRNEAAYKSLGDILKQKADRHGVRVLLLVWDDKTSHSIINNEGVMGTHDEETKRFFKHSNVSCLLAPRYADTKLSWVKQKIVGTLFTHHQKLVIVDAQGPQNKRRLVSFLGGLDLCDGRYDTPEHHLFHNLNTVFQDDYHNPTFPSKVECGGPRQPWHDLHCKIEGPAVYDVLKNFEQRWLKASRWHGLSLKIRTGNVWHDHSLINLNEVPWAFSLGNESQPNHQLNVTNDKDIETWHIQIFRSIDSGSVKGFPKTVMEAEKANLVGGKNIAIDMSIHTAYIKAIRCAQHFIYIENQYFLGSSFAWPHYKNAGANHLIPIELALKIVSKIKAKERFAVYVVIPMWPEGAPSSSSVQEILFFQGQTMEMMYTLIAEALTEAGLDDEYHPTDYLNFFCLGSRELKPESEPDPKVPPTENSAQAQVLKSRRFMIYVHAKGMVVDDEYVIIGSANINQRSMDGARDTEIAMGAYQPHYCWDRKKNPPRGQVYGYRMSLWAEHLQADHHSFKEPWRVDCVRKVREIGEEYWKQFTADEVTEMKGHLLTYPVKVEDSGKVVPLPDCEVFPDVGGKILGSSTQLPDSLTT